MSVIINTKTKKILALGPRAKSAHDVKDVKCLIKRPKHKPVGLVADKEHDVKWTHRYCMDPVYSGSNSNEKLWKQNNLSWQRFEDKMSKKLARRYTIVEKQLNQYSQPLKESLEPV